MKAWIVGNGESLNQTPLDRIKDDCFGVNRIHKLYSATTWRPKYYTRFEPQDWAHDSDVFFDECMLHINAGEQCIFPHWEQELGIHPNVEYVNSCHHYKRRKPPTAWHLPFICDFNAVTAAMQIAVLKGYKEIILVGCDLTGGHFSTDYRGMVQTDLWRMAHEIAARDCPVPVYNATIGGSLEAYPRVDIERFL